MPEAPQPYPAQAHALLEFGKQGFDLTAGPPRTLIGWRSGQRADRLSGRFLPMHEEPAIGRGSTALLLRTPLALGRGRAVGIALTIPAGKGARIFHAQDPSPRRVDEIVVVVSHHPRSTTLRRQDRIGVSSGNHLRIGHGVHLL